jgi:ribosomal protein S1
VAQMTMADLLAKQDKQVVRISRGQEIEGKIIADLEGAFILDLGAKAEGVLPKRDLSAEQIEKFKVGERITSYVIYPENDSGPLGRETPPALPALTKLKRIMKF